MKVYEAGNLNSELYSNFRIKYNQLWESERAFLNKKYLQDGMSILDVGGASGALGDILQKKFDHKYDYTCIDPDSKAINKGKILYPNLNFIKGYFPNDLPKLKKYDLVILTGWFAQVIEWKKLLTELCSRSKKFINIALNFRLEGTTVTDPDLSYVYYLDTGIRVPEITHNIFEFINYVSCHELLAKKIMFYGYTRPQKPTSAYRPLERKKQIQGNLLIEKFLGSDGDFKRIGGISNQALSAMGGQFKFATFKPEYKILINGKKLKL